MKHELKQERRNYAEIAPKPPEGEVDLPSLVAGEGPLELDVGFGRGSSLFERAAAAPEARIVGIEIKAKWAFKVEERRTRRKLHRVAVLNGDAREILGRAGPPASVQRVFVHFPDPWWKKRHRKRRVLDDPFLSSLARLLRVGGELFVQTDVADRADDYELLLRRHPAFDPRRVPDNPYGARSNREKRADEDGLPVYRIVAVRIASEGCGDDASETDEQHDGADGDERDD